jgi:hypothetical protein
MNEKIRLEQLLGYLNEINIQTISTKLSISATEIYKWKSIKKNSLTRKILKIGI